MAEPVSEPAGSLRSWLKLTCVPSSLVTRVHWLCSLDNYLCLLYSLLKCKWVMQLSRCSGQAFWPSRARSYTQQCVVFLISSPVWSVWAGIDWPPRCSSQAFWSGWPGATGTSAWDCELASLPGQGRNISKPSKACRGFDSRWPAPEVPWLNGATGFALMIYPQAWRFFSQSYLVYQ